MMLDDAYGYNGNGVWVHSFGFWIVLIILWAPLILYVLTFSADDVDPLRVYFFELKITLTLSQLQIVVIVVAALSAFVCLFTPPRKEIYSLTKEIRNEAWGEFAEKASGEMFFEGVASMAPDVFAKESLYGIVRIGLLLPSVLIVGLIGQIAAETATSGSIAMIAMVYAGVIFGLQAGDIMGVILTFALRVAAAIYVAGVSAWWIVAFATSLVAGFLVPVVGFVVTIIVAFIVGQVLKEAIRFLTYIVFPFSAWYMSFFFVAMLGYDIGFFVGLLALVLMARVRGGLVGVAIDILENPVNRPVIIAGIGTVLLGLT